MRKRLYEIIETANDNDNISQIYDITMLITIFISLIPLVTKKTGPVLTAIDIITVIIFIIDYVLRLITADYKLNRGAKSYILYPFTPMAIVDLLAILPSLVILKGSIRLVKASKVAIFSSLMTNKGLRLFKVFRLLRTLRVFRSFRVFKAFRYSKTIDIVISVIKKQKDALIAVCVMAISYILIVALIIFNVEPDTFYTFFDAVYWATISLTTVGYGDIFAVTTVGKVITMISSLVGIAVVALPSGIITAGFMEELEESKKSKE